jgi:hypothetical protein
LKIMEIECLIPMRGMVDLTRDRGTQEVDPMKEDREMIIIGRIITISIEIN